MQGEAKAVFRESPSGEEFSTCARMALDLSADEFGGVLCALERALERQHTSGGERTPKGLRFDLALYERLHWLAYGALPEEWFYDKLRAEFIGEGFPEVIEAARRGASVQAQAGRC